MLRKFNPRQRVIIREKLDACSLCNVNPCRHGQIGDVLYLQDSSAFVGFDTRGGHYPHYVGGIYPVECLELAVNGTHAVQEPEPKDNQDKVAKPSNENVWRWCSVCWVRTDHKPIPIGDKLQCTVCGTRVPKTSPDKSEAYKVPVADDSEIAVETEPKQWEGLETDGNQ